MASSVPATPVEQSDGQVHSHNEEETNPPWNANGTIGSPTCSRGCSTSRTVFDLAGCQQKLADIDRRMAEPTFWDRPETAQEVVISRKSLLGTVEPLTKVGRALDDVSTMLELSDEDPSFADEIRRELPGLEEALESLELKALLGGEHDQCGALVSIHARDGGTDANDWAEMLLRMYISWAEQNDYQIELLDRGDNEEAGINQATIAVRGPFAYGYLKGETGMHRLVRISPFNAEGKRQTSFAAVDVSPEVDDRIEIEIDENDVREDTFRASGAGGQHVNKTE